MLGVAFAVCDFDLNGKWVLDFEHYLNSVSKGDPDVRQEANDIWDGQSFIKIAFNGVNGKFSQRGKGGWSSFNFSYRITVAENDSCLFTLNAYSEDAEAMSESMTIRIAPEGFCLLPSAHAKWADCYVRDNQ